MQEECEQVLESAYAMSAVPDSGMLELLRRSTGMELAHIAAWFQRRQQADMAAADGAASHGAKGTSARQLVRCATLLSAIAACPCLLSTSGYSSPIR